MAPVPSTRIPSAEDSSVPTAGLLVIGDEILSGKVTDANAPFLIGELRALGVRLCEIAVIADDVREIAQTVSRLAARYDHVFTSGGIGPTHDDLTIAGVALAFDVPVVRHSGLESLLRGYYTARLASHPDEGPSLAASQDRNLRMADVPEGAVLISGVDLRWPVVMVRNVYVLPGIPEIFRRKFRVLSDRLRSTPFHVAQVLVRADEGELAAHLDVIAATYPALALGSYPRVEPAEDGHRVRLTLESKDLALVEQATEHLLRLLSTIVPPTVVGRL